MQIINRVIALGNIEKTKLEQICFKCPGLLKDDLKEIAEHYNMTVTSLIINSCTALVEDFKGSDYSSLTVQQSRACLKLDDLEEELEQYLAVESDADFTVIEGYPFQCTAIDYYRPKIERILERIKNLKQMIGEE